MAGKRQPAARSRKPRAGAGYKALRAQDLFEHDADFGVIGRGRTLEAAFEAAAGAMFSIVADPAPGVRGERRLAFEFDEPDVELALVTWLNRLLAEARCGGLALCRFHVRRENAHWRGEAWGQPWRTDIARGTEVKGATLTMLSVREMPGGWEARCVVDV